MTQFYGHVLADVELKYGDSCPDTQTLAVWDLKYKYHQVKVVLQGAAPCVCVNTPLSHYMNNKYICDLQIVDIYQNIRPD